MALAMQSTHSIRFSRQMKVTSRKLAESLEKYRDKGLHVPCCLFCGFHSFSEIRIRETNTSTGILLPQIDVKRLSWTYGWSRKNILASLFHEWGFHTVLLLDTLFMSMLHGPSSIKRPWKMMRIVSHKAAVKNTLPLQMSIPALWSNVRLYSWSSTNRDLPPFIHIMTSSVRCQ